MSNKFKKMFLLLTALVVFACAVNVSAADKWYWPTETKYNWSGSTYKNHSGWDMKAPSNTPLYAPFDGYVTFKRYYREVPGHGKVYVSYGNCAELISDNGKTKMIFAHMSSFEGYSFNDSEFKNAKDVWPNECINSNARYPLLSASGNAKTLFVGKRHHVTEGTTLGYSGGTGRSTGPHLHVTLYVNGNFNSFVDPRPYFDRAKSARENARKVTILGSDKTIYVGEKNGFAATAKPAGSKIYWKSSNPLVAWVDSNGAYKGILAGSVKISAFLKDENGNIITSSMDSRTVTVKNRVDIKKAVVTLSKTSYYYTGKIIKPGVTVKYNGKNLSKGTDYTVSYSDKVSMGKVSVKISGKGKYKGSVTQKFNILPKFELSNSSITINLKNKKTYQLSAKIKCGTTAPEVIWSTSNKKIATVSSKGNVTGKNVGNAVISATIKTSVGTFTKKCKVKVIKESSGGGCFTPDTMITLGDGSQKRVDELEETDIIQVYDFDNGKVTSAPITVFHKVEEEAPVLRVEFANGISIGIVKDHCLFDLTDRCFVLINSDAQEEELEGHTFAILKDGEIAAAELTDIRKDGMTDAYYAPVSEAHLNCFANGLLNMPGYVTGFCNVFELEDDELKYDAEKKQEEIEAAGFIESDLFAAIRNTEIYKKNKLDWLGVSVAKGLIDVDKLMEVYNFCLPYFVEGHK